MSALQGNEDAVDSHLQMQTDTPQPPAELTPSSEEPALSSQGESSQATEQTLDEDATPRLSGELPAGATASDCNSVTNSEPPFPLHLDLDKQKGRFSTGSDISSDRVFPIRSVIRVDHANIRNPRDDYFPTTRDGEIRNLSFQPPNNSREMGSDLRRSDTMPARISDDMTAVTRRKNTGGPMSSIQLDAARQGHTHTPLELDTGASDLEVGEPLPALDIEPDASSATSTGQSLPDAHITTRFTHVVTEEGYALITGRDGVLQRCEDEPIHTPGAIQIFGVLLALREEAEGYFVVRYASENSERLLGYSPRQLFQLNNFLDILTEEQQDNLLDHIDFIRDEDADPSINGPEVFSLSIRTPKMRSRKLWCAIHINPAHPDLVICEFEMDDDLEYPLRPGEEMTPDTPHDTLQANPTMDEIEESTEILSKPLRILRSARKRRGEQGAMQVFDILSQVQEQLANATSLETFLKVLVGIIKELTGFHRVMIYQFDSNFNGKVVTELVNTSQTRDLYKGLHFPASDIPRQARDLYKLNKVRLLFDRDHDTARIVCRTQEDLDIPLDMSHAYLRAMSPIHIKYLKNMAVRSSMSISINAFNELWGLISCHSYGNQGTRVSFPIRKMCRLVGDTASRNIERLSYASRLQARKLINTAPSDKNPSGYIIASSEDLLKLFDADFGLLSIKGETKILGGIDHSQEALAMLEYLRMRKLTSVVATQNLVECFPDLRYAPGFQVIAGLLYVPLSVGGSDFIVFFRRAQIKEVKWAGNPYEKLVREGTASYLEPRTSFKTWHEMVVGTCREWNEEQIETAAVLCLVYGKFIEVWRQKEAALQSSKFTRLLLANSAHEVRTPLNAIINYLEIALEGSLDQETRENLARSHSASKSLIYVINDLLDLTQTEEGQSLVKNEIFDLAVCINEATSPFEVDAKRKGIKYDIVEHPGLPHFVHGDERRVRQAISNVTANAVAHTDSGHVKVEVFVSEVSDRQAVVDFVVEDTGAGMSSRQIEVLFRDLEQVSAEESPLPSPQGAETASNIRTLGLGLAVVGRIVRNMGGQLRLKSEVGQGSRFVIQLPFQLPDDATISEAGSINSSSRATMASNAAVSVPASMTAAPEGEILLVNRSNMINLKIEERAAGSKQASLETRKSTASLTSHDSHRSDADRLIDAIQTPLSLDDKESEYPFLPGPALIGGSNLPALAEGKSVKSCPTDPNQHKPQTAESIAQSEEHGAKAVRDSKTPLKAVRIPDEYIDVPLQPPTQVDPPPMLELSGDKNSPTQKARASSVASTATDQFLLQVLIAEDDPINVKILRKRLERAGHDVHHTVNGEDCAAVYREKSAGFDVVLMDMQMPIVDGLTSTKLIRALEMSPEHAGHSPLAASNYRIPIFAVSASLVERERQTYIDAGFDGWILKPIDFKRLSSLLLGITEEGVRNSCLYKPGEWERGGWFCSRPTIEPGSNGEITPKAEDHAKELKQPEEGSQS
ncbi:putative phytochrome-like histidine kinase PHY1p [Dactylonectria estremocensis]|uniref:Phytochrome-like histidine kinase PHY1p n=1 Tax=Dactylonectria estremocensis TaxID=1079267 RepID=A0A9P9FC49_9HYPO|nr:putative phytochrome-like histidine kinase PHY1p [Dactylonectria estremocensis]